MFKKFLSLIAALIVVISLASCSNSSSTNDKKLKVAVSFNAMKELTYAIGKNKINIVTIIPNGTEPHDFDPKAKDIKTLYDSKIFIYSGLGMETWVDKTLKSVNNKDLISVEASNGVKAIKNSDASEIAEHGKYDPHSWLSLNDAKIESKNIRDALTKADPTNKKFYYDNYNEFCKKVDSLNQEYVDKFKTVKNKDFVTGHAAFAYLCRDYNLNQKSVENVFADGEPSTKQLADLTKYCKDNNVKTVFYEDMVSPKVSSTLAKEVNAKTQKIYTIESAEDGKDYLASMKADLDAIYTSLK
ncbi:metal ABC transporter substrate-binding protein [Clostridium felsineum]|uniref:metal ABC transporter substrate-binding protein n=1 Tax=Clostridium felsineum TaxID=36839 RepID=UPI00098C120F|nr:metal ABC transporter substrate-binding protein [Clostridium felsineum]URZ16469.1 High-affinity zinc uptake system binding-protein ZnuA [Clostridium felsineum DSM 794]